MRRDFHGRGLTKVRVIHTDEELMIANTVCHVLGIPLEKEHIG